MTKAINNLDLEKVFDTITKGLAGILKVDLSLIWLLNRGDRCRKCPMVPECKSKEFCLHLKSRAGHSKVFDNQIKRVPLNQIPVGRIALEKKIIFSNNLSNEYRHMKDEWFGENSIESFAGYPLIIENDLIGVMGLFSSHKLVEDDLSSIPDFIDQVAMAVENTRKFDQLVQINKRLQDENVCLRGEIISDGGFEEIVGQSEKIKDQTQLAKQVAKTDTTVLLLGDTGTGKELFARAIHTMSLRKDQPFIKVNCATLQPTLIESELFGHVKGAFTGAVSSKKGRFDLATGGTIFLDEIGELPIEIQSKILEVVETGRFQKVGSARDETHDARVIVATNVNLEKAVVRGRFRKDLFFRLNVFPIRLPRLRHRKNDIPILTEHFIKLYNAKFCKRIVEISPAAMNRLITYSWPGNVRELKNIIERAVILAEGSVLKANEITNLQISEPSTQSSSLTLHELELRHIQNVLNQTNWIIEGQHGAAALLDINPSTLRYRIKKLKLVRPQDKP